MQIFSWNVNGIRAVANKGELVRFLSQHHPDILCIQETKARQGQAEINLPDYEEFWSSADRPGYSGTAIFVKNTIAAQAIAVKMPGDLCDQYGDLTREGRVTAVELPDFFLVCVYTPNSKGDLSRLNIRQRWDAAFLGFVNGLRAQKPVIFCGDLNVAHREIDLARPADNVGKHGFTNEERAGFQAIIDSGFRDVFRDINGDATSQYTWWSHWARARERNIGWRIDYFLVSADIAWRVTSAEIWPEQMGSDHCPISITIDLDSNV